MKLTTYKKIKLVLAISGIPTSLATTYKIANWMYRRVGADMLPWILIALVAAISICAYVYIGYKEKEEKNKTEREDNEKFVKWLTYHSQYFNKQQYDSLEEKILDLIDHKIEYFEGRIKRGEIKP